jgi:hypothetical protein
MPGQLDIAPEMLQPEMIEFSPSPVPTRQLLRICHRRIAQFQSKYVYRQMSGFP